MKNFMFSADIPVYRIYIYIYSGILSRNRFLLSACVYHDNMFLYIFPTIRRTVVGSFSQCLSYDVNFYVQFRPRIGFFSRAPHPVRTMPRPYTKVTDTLWFSLPDALWPLAFRSHLAFGLSARYVA